MLFLTVYILNSMERAVPGAVGLLVRRLWEALDRHEERLRAEQRRDMIRVEWQQLALVIDR